MGRCSTNSASVRVGIDLGGTKIEIIALSADGEVLLRRRIPTPQGDYSATLSAIAQLIQQAEQEVSNATSIGIGVPGSISPETGLIRNANSVCLNDQRLQEDIESLLQRKVRISNDANCFVLSESTDGAAAGADSVFGVILGTGVGAGLVINGQLVEGCNGNAGEWGHNPLPWVLEREYPGSECWCGQQGCIETWLSGPGMMHDHFEHTRQTLKPDEIMVAAENGDQQAEMTLQRYESRLARGLSHIINIFDPQIIVLGGGMSNIERLYSNVPVRLKTWVFSDCVKTQLLPPTFGDSSGVRGAAWLW